MPNTSPLVRDRASTPRVGFYAGVLDGGGGLERVELQAAAGLSERGWAVDCLYQEGGDLLPAWEAAATLQRRDGDRVVAASQPSGSPRQALTGRDLQCSDVVYVHDPERFAAASELARSLGRPVVGHLHLPPFFVRSGWQRFVRGRLHRDVDRSIFGPESHIDRFIAVSEHTRRKWLHAGLPEDRVHVVYNGIDLRRYRAALPGERLAVRERLGIGRDDFVVGYVGRIDHAKGVEQLVRAVASVAASSSRPISLVVAGAPSRWAGADGDRYEAELRKLAPANTLWIGPRDDVPELYRTMDLLVVPSQWDEPFGLVAAEALASGVPALCTRRGGLVEVMAGPLAANLVGTSWRAIARGIARHIEDPARGPRLGQEGRRIVERRFDVQRAIAEIERVLRGVM